jgi:protein gp37
MSDKSHIGWTDASWNPVTGCDRVSPGCAHCYALTFAERFRGVPGHYFEHGFDVQLRPDKLDLPLRWRKPKRIFVNSMSDLFHKQVPDEFIDRVFGVMSATPRHTYQVLTKRPERMLRYLTERGNEQTETHALYDEISGARFRIERYAAEYEAADLGELLEWREEGEPLEWPRQNVHLGVSVENQHWADVRIPLLLQTPAAVLWISAEPLLGPLDLSRYLLRGLGHDEYGTWDVERAIDWVVVGGESGPGRREMDLDWARSLRDQCLAAGVPFFFKQPSGPKQGMPSGDPELDECKAMPR